MCYINLHFTYLLTYQKLAPMHTYIHTYMKKICKAQKNKKKITKHHDLMTLTKQASLKKSLEAVK